MPEPAARIFESVPNVSTADAGVVRELAATLSRPPAVRLINASSDARHGRTVFTVLGPEEPLLDALVALALRCNELVDLEGHEGLHPRVGHLDVVPLIALHPPGPPEEAAGAAGRLIERLRREAGLWCAPYDAAASAGTSLPEVRRGGLARLWRRIEAGEVEAFAPEDDAEERRSKRGVTCVGARRPLVAFNVELETGELRIARRVAHRLREATGGLPAVRALGLKLEEDRVQVSMNLIDPERTGVLTAYEWVERLAGEEGASVARSELVGCTPRAAWPAGLGARVKEPDVPVSEEPRRILESWLPGGELEADDGLRPSDLPEPEEKPADEGAEGSAEDERRLRLLDLPLPEANRRLGTLMEELSEPSYRASQVANAIWKNNRRSFDEMTDLPRELRAKLAERAEIGLLEISERAASSDGTVKYLWRCPDGAEIESVSIPTERRTTFCISSQVGCSLKCRFCATGYLGFGRNLSAGEILDQVLGMLADQGLSSEKLNVVFMGQGEPGHNMKAVLHAVRVLNDAAGLNVGARRITVSTSGVVGAIRELAAEPIQLRFALSLHAADQTLRESLMNIAEKHSLDDLLEACRAYHQATRRHVTLEYCVIPGVTDGSRNAASLSRWGSSFPSKVNLIPYNPVEEFQTAPADHDTCRRFRDALLQAGYQGEVMIRATRGRDIEAACGMLHRHRGAEAGAAGA